MSNNKYKILIVEDEKNISNVLKTVINGVGYHPIIATTASEAKIIYSSHTPDLVILDLGLPDEDGKNVIKYIRDIESTPIIILSARNEENEKVTALDLGANDYVTKPFGSAELVARIRSALRNSRRDSGTFEGQFVLRDLLIDRDARRVYIRNNEIKLTQTEYNIVALLVEHSGKMLTYSSIIKKIWGSVDESSVKRLQVNMANIRKKFGSRPGVAGYIINELGVGYIMNNDKDE